MLTADKRASALGTDLLALNLDDFDALQKKLELLMMGSTGDLMERGQSLRDEFLPPECEVQRAERDQEESIQAPRSRPNGAGL